MMRYSTPLHLYEWAVELHKTNGCFDGEGHVGGHRRGKYVYGYIGAKNTNFEVIKYVGELLDRFSIHYNLYKVKERSRNSKPYLIFINRGKDVKRFHELGVFQLVGRLRNWRD